MRTAIRTATRPVVLALSLALSLVSIAAAQDGSHRRSSPISEKQAAAQATEHYRELTRELRRNVQEHLVWTGHYDGFLDGIIGPRSRAAVAAFQKALGTTADGLLTEEEAEKLFEAGTKAREKARFTLGNETVAGLYIGLPYAVTDFAGEAEDGIFYNDPQERFRIRTFRSTGVDGQLFADEAFADVEGYERSYVHVDGGQVVVIGLDATEHLYLRALRRGNELRGFYVWYDKALDETHRHLVVAMANSLRWGELQAPVSRTPGDLPRGIPGLPDASAGLSPESVPIDPNEPLSTGTAFAVNADGTFVTNAHVIATCGRVTVGTFGEARVVSKDDDLDLAILAVPQAKGIAVARLADDDAVLAESVLAFGFPLPETLGASLGVSRGSVSSLVGAIATREQFRMTAAVQPGNSGGPLLDEEGRVIGVVTSKLNAMEIANQIGDIPQSMNFAVKVSALRTYLAGLKIGVATLARTGTVVSGPQIARTAKAFTQPVSCFAQ